jgi:tripartite-type tricarboxylate transporter receptor subunit TctC
MKNILSRNTLRAAALAAITCAQPCAALAETAAEFYARTPLTIAIGTGVGGVNDLIARTLMRHLGRHMPAGARVQVQNVPGAGGLTLANQLAKTTPRDGSVIASINRAAIFDELYEGRHGRVMFNPREFNWIGSPDRATAVAISWHTSKVRTASDLLQHELVVGSAGATTTTVPKLLGELAGFKFKIVVGYKSGGDVDLAIQRGEVEGRGATAWGGLKSRNSEWINEKKVNLLYQTGLSKHPDLPHVPLALDFAKNPDDRKLLELFFAAEDLGFPYVAPAGVPAERLAVLRAAFENTMKDSLFLSEMTKQKLDVNPVSWQDMKRIVDESYSAPESLKLRLRNALKE